MLGHAGYFTALPEDALSKMIDLVKGVQPQQIPQATAQVPDAKRPSLFALGRRIASQDARHSLAAAVSVMEIPGRGPAKESGSVTPTMIATSLREKSGFCKRQARPRSNFYRRMVRADVFRDLLSKGYRRYFDEPVDQGSESE